MVSRCDRVQKSAYRLDGKAVLADDSPNIFFLRLAVERLWSSRLAFR
jgi:hypothetical protein